MWEILKFYLSSSWVSSSLLATACLLSCWQLSSLISILVRLRKSSSPNERSIRMKDLEGLKPVPEAYPAIIVKTSAVMLVMCVAVFAFGAVSLKQKKQCTATGDFFESDSMYVQGPAGYPNSYNVMGKDQRVYRITFCPTSPNISLRKGDFIQYAKYEYRDGCLDFSSQEAALQIK